MELKEFVEKHLPNYKERHAKSTAQALKLGVDDQEVVDLLFHTKLHSEALQNFTNKISKKQRENCADVVAEFLPQQNKLTIKVSNAEQPKIDEV